MNLTPTKSIRAATAGLVVALTLSGAALAVASPAGASTTRLPVSSFQAKKAKCLAEIDIRVWAMGVSKARIDSARHLTVEQKAAINTTIVDVYTNLTTVNRPAVRDASTTEALGAACQAIYSDNRVFAVVLPQVWYTGQIDVLDNAADKLTEKSQGAQAQGKDTAAADAKIASAQARLDDSAASLATVTADSFNADPAAARAAFEHVRGQNFAAFVELLTAHGILQHL